MAIIEFKKVCLRYPIYGSHGMSLRSHFMRVATGGNIEKDSRTTVITALRDVSFTLKDGDAVGLIGHNGAGKSTMLRTMAGIYPPSSGRVVLQGKTSTVFEIGAGLNPELSGYDNIINLAMMMGLNHSEAKALTPDIEDFTELGDFLRMPTFQPRKNIERIVDAHEALPTALRKAVPLLIVGRNGWGAEELVARLRAYGPDGDVRWLQNVGDVAKRVMMQRATALVFPSLLEGFGLPVLEGFASQTPVITSNVTSLPEVAGNAAWLVDPYSVPALTEAMVTLAREDAVGRDLVAKGLVRARQFTWDACARQTVQVYEQVLSKS